MGPITQLGCQNSFGVFHHSTAHVPSVGLLLEFFTFVVKFFAPPDGHADLHHAAFEIYGSGDQRETLLPGGLREFSQFAFVKQQLALAFGFVIHHVGLGVLGDVASHEPKLAIFQPRVGFIDGDFIVPHAFDFAAFEHDSAFEFIQQVVLMPGFAVSADHAGIGVFTRLFFLLGFAHGFSRLTSYRDVLRKRFSEGGSITSYRYALKSKFFQPGDRFPLRSTNKSHLARSASEEACFRLACASG